MTITQNQVESDFVYGKLPKLKVQHGENHQALKEEWKKYLAELASEQKIPSHAKENWKYPS